MRIRCFALTLAVTLLCTVAAGTADGQQDQGIRKVGVRIGGTIDPDQFHFGSHYNAGRIADRLRFQPSIEIGIGDNQTTAVANADVLYLAHRSRTVQVLAGGGFGIGGRWSDAMGDPAKGNAGAKSDVLAGVNLLAGIEYGSRPAADAGDQLGSGVRYLLEFRAGLGDLPAFRFTVGLNF